MKNINNIFILKKSLKSYGTISIKIAFITSIFVIAFTCLLFINPFSKKAYIENVPVISQLPELPTGCEVTSLSMLLSYNGIDVSKITLANDMPKTELTYINDVDYAEHPSIAFLGNPFTEDGYGIYSPAILKMIEQYTPGRAVDLNGKNLNELLKIVKKGKPVMAWATINLKPVTLTDKWITPSGEEFTWKAGEHALIIVGYDGDTIIVNDPLEGKEITYSKNLFKKRYNEMGKMALTIS